jgi:hypothetical protein
VCVWIRPQARTAPTKGASGRASLVVVVVVDVDVATKIIINLAGDRPLFGARRSPAAKVGTRRASALASAARWRCVGGAAAADAAENDADEDTCEWKLTQGA